MDEEDAAAVDERRTRRTRGGRVALPPDLPRVEVVHELPEATRHCPEDGTEPKVIGEEVSEELHVVPARVEVIRHVRRKYACPTCEEGVQIAPAPAKLLPKSNASATLLAYVATAKYQDVLGRVIIPRRNSLDSAGVLAASRETESSVRTRRRMWYLSLSSRLSVSRRWSLFDLRQHCDHHNSD